MFGDKGKKSGIARQEAKKNGDKHYIAGNKCRHCGSYKKYTSSCGCVDCNIKLNVSKLYDKELMKPYRTKALAAALQGRYRANKVNQMPADVNHALIKKVYEKAERMTKETGIMHHVDHIIPISKGGLHHEDNLQVLTERENLMKGNKII